MAWTPKTGGTASGGSLSISAISGAALSVGDVVCVAVTFDLATGSVTGAVADDDLGNTYSTLANVAVRDGVNQGLTLFVSIITHAGTPTVRVRFLPTPGTTASGALSLNVDPFSGSDSASATDGTGAGQVQAAPGTGANGATSGSFTTATDGDLIYTAVVDSVTGGNPGSVGTGFTLLQTSGGVIIKTAYKAQPTHGAVAGTWTAAVNDTHITAALAVTPATGGGGAGGLPFLPGAYRPQFTRPRRRYL